MPNTPAAELTLLISREQAENAFRAAMAIYVGGKNRYSVEKLCKGIGLVKDGKPHTKPIYDFTSYPAGSPDHRPLHMGLMLSITKFLGAEFTNEWIVLANQAAHDLSDDEPDPGELAADSSENTAKVVRMAADGSFKNDCPKELRETGTAMMTHGMKLVATAASARRAVG